MFKETSLKLNFSFLLSLLLLLSINAKSQSTSWTGTTSTAWGTSTNWTNGVPTSSIDAVIGDASFTGPNQPSVTRKATAKSVTVGGTTSATLTLSKNLTVLGSVTINSNGTISHGVSTLSLSGNWSNSGTYTTTSNSKSKTIFNGSSQTISGSSTTTFRHLTVNLTSTLTLAVNCSLSGSLTVNGTLDPATFTITGSGSPSMTINSGATLKVKTALFTGNYTGFATPTASGGSIVEYSGTVSQTINSAITYSSLAIRGTGTTKSLTSNLPTLRSADTTQGRILVYSGTLNLSTFTATRGTTVTGGLLQVSNDASLILGASNFPTNYNTISLAANSTVEYNSSSTQTVTATTYGNLTFSGGNSKTMPASAMTIYGNLTTSGSGTSFTAGNTLTITGNVDIGSGTTFTGGSFTHTVSGNWTNAGTFTGSTSTVVLNGAAKVISGSGTNTFNNLTISGVGITTSGTVNLTVGGDLSGSGTYAQSAGTLTMSGTSKSISGAGFSFNNLTLSGTITTSASFIVAGDINISGTFTASSGTITLSGASKTISGAGTKTFSSITISGTYSTSVSASISGNLSVTGSLTASAGTVTFSGTSTLSGTANLFNVTVNATSFSPGTSSNLGVANTLTLTSGLNTSTTIPNTITFNGSGAQSIPTGTYYNLATSTGGTKSLSGNVTANGTITIGSSTTLSPGSNSIDLYRNWTNNGTFTAGTSTVTFRGQVSTVSGTNTFSTLVINKSSSNFYLSLSNNTSAATVTVTTGFIQTNSDTLTITSSRTGSGYIYGNINRTQTFNTGVDYTFEGADNYINFSSVTGVTSIIVSVYPSSLVSDYSNNAAINRYYYINIPSGTYTATLRLHYEDAELNGNTESALSMKRYNGSSWTDQTPTGNNTTSNYYEKSGLTAITNRWTLAAAENVVAWTGSSSTVWATAGNWTVVSGTPNTPPQSGDIVLIGDRAFTNQPTISSSVNVRSILFQNTTTSTVTLSTGGSLTTIGNITGSWSGNATHSIDVNSRSLTVGGALVLSDGTSGHDIDIIASSGTITVNGTLAVAGNSLINLTAAASLNIGGDFTYTAGTFSAGSSSTTTYNGTGLQIVAPVTYYNLTINKASGVAKAAGALTIGGNLTLTSGELDVDNTVSITGNYSQSVSTTAYFDNSAVSVTLQGNFSNSGTMVTTFSTYTFSGTNSQQVTGGAFNNLVVNKASGTVTLASNATIANNFTITSGTLNLSTFTANRTQSGGTFTLSNGATLQVGGSNNFPANFAVYTLGATSNTQYNGTSTQTVKDITYGNLSFSNGSTNAKTLNSLTMVAGDLTINSGATFSTSSNSLILSGNWTNNGTFTPSTGTLTLSGTSKTIDGATTFNNLNVTGSYTVNGVSLGFNGAVEVTGTFATGSGTMTVSGDLTNRGSLSNTGAVIYTGNQTQTLRLVNAVSSIASGVTNFNGSVAPILSSNSSPTFGVLNINNTANITPSVGWTVVGAFTVASGSTFAGGPYTHVFQGAFTNNGTVTTRGTLQFTPSSSVTVNFGTGFTSTGVVDFAGSGLITLSGTPAKLTNVTVTNTNASGLTPIQGWTLLGYFTLSSGSVFNASSFTHSVGGDISLNGTLNGQTSTFTLSSTNGYIESNDLSVFNNLTISSGAVIEALSNVSLSGNFSNSGSYTLTNNPLIFTGSGNSSISASSYPFKLGNLIVQKSVQSSTVTLNGSLDSVGTISIVSGTLNASTQAITEESGSGEFYVDSLATYLTSRTSAPVIPTFTLYTLANYSNVEYGATTGTQAINTALTYGNLILSGSGGTKSASAALTVNNNFTLTSATFTAGSFTHNIGGDWTMASGTFTNTGSTINFNGTINQTITSTGNFNNLTVNKSAGVLLMSSNVTLGSSGTLTLTSGVVSGRGNTLIVSNTATGAISRTSGWVNGILRRSIPGSGTNQTYSFQMGDSLNYTPASVTFASLTGTGTLTASNTATDHPQISGSGVSLSKSVNRYYSLTNSGITFTTYNATFNFVSGDLDAGVTTGNLIVAKYSGSTWSLPTTSGTTSTSATISSASSFSDFAIGESSNKVWSGGGGTLNWNTASNWSPTGVPVASDSVTISANTGVVLVNTAGVVNSLVLSNASGFGLQISSSNSLTVGGILTLSTAGIDINGQTLTLNGTFSGTGTGTIRGSNTSNLAIGGSGALGTIRMNQTTPGTTNLLNNFTFNRLSTGTLSLSNQMQVIGVVTHTAGTLTTGGNLILRATDTTTYGQIAGTGSGDISGSVTAEYYIQANAPGKWRNICSPFTGNTLADLSDDLLLNTGTPNYSYINMFRLDESLGGSSSAGAWQAITSTTKSMDTVGFSIYQFSENFTSAVTMDLTGTYTKSNYTTPALSRTGSITDTTGYHLIRNPWPSNYLHNTTITNLVSNTIYVYDGQTVRDYNGSTGSLPNGVVPPFHAMMVQINTNGNTLTLPTANRTTSNSANYHNKTDLMNYVGIKVTNQKGIWDETRLYTDDNAQNGYDFWDANKILNDKSAPSIFTMVEGNKTSINLMNNIPVEGAVIPVNFISETEGLHTISFTTANTGAGKELFLQDYLTGTTHRIANGTYTFIHKKNSDPARFALHFGAGNLTSTSEKLIKEEKIFVYVNNKKVFLVTPDNQQGKVEIVDVLGRILYQGGIEESQQTIDMSGISSKYLFVRILTNSDIKTFKILIN